MRSSESWMRAGVAASGVGEGVLGGASVRATGGVDTVILAGGEAVGLAGTGGGGGAAATFFLHPPAARHSAIAAETAKSLDFIREPSKYSAYKKSSRAEHTVDRVFPQLSIKLSFPHANFLGNDDLRRGCVGRGQGNTSQADGYARRTLWRSLTQDLGVCRSRL